MNTFITATAAAIVIAAPAFAGNIQPAAPAPIIAAPVATPVYSFTGFSAGLAAGYADGDFTDEDGVTGGGLALSGDGAFLGLRLNYDYDFGSVIAGGTLQYDNLSLGLDNDADPDLNDQLDSVLRAGLRFGLDSGRNYYYLTGGYAEANLEGGGDVDGSFIGLGYEVFLTQNITVGAEVLAHEFDDLENVTAGDLDSNDLTTFALSVNYRF